MADWTPAEISTLLWLKADQISGLSDGDKVSTWADQSGEENDAVQSTDAYRPVYKTGIINGKPIVRFSGTKALVLPTIDTSPAVTYIVVMSRAGTGNYAVIAYNTSYYAFLDYSSWYVGDYGASITRPTNTFQVFTGQMVPGTDGAKRWLDGTAQGSTTGSSSGSYPYRMAYLGATDSTGSYGFYGDIAEVIVTSSTDTDTREKLEGYAAWKYGLEDNLPTGHTYKSTAPTVADPVVVLAGLEQLYQLVPSVPPAVIGQLWGLRTGADTVQAWTGAPVLTADLAQWWDDAGLLAQTLVQRWQDAAPLAAVLAQPWGLPMQLAAAWPQPWALGDGVVVAGLDQPWALRDRTLLTATARQSWALVPDGSEIATGGSGSTGGEGSGSTGGSALLRYTLTVTAGGSAIGCSQLTIEGSLDQDVLTYELHPATEADYLACAEGVDLIVDLVTPTASESYRLVVTSARIDEQWGQTRYVVEAMSPAALLGDPYAAGIEGELTGMASAVAATLAGAVPLDWQTVDWAITPGVWIASGETPLALLKQLAGAVGAVVQSQPDGSLLVLPGYPLSVPSWATASAALALVDVLDCATTGTMPDHRPGYNRYLIGNQVTSAGSLTIEEETLSATVKEIRVYQVPWADDFELAHTGGAWVTIEPQGIEQRQETETVEFVGGAGRVRYPLHGLGSVAWLQANLGTLTTAEDGGLTAAVAAESLAEIIYTTRCRLYRVTDNQDEQLQLVAYL